MSKDRADQDTPGRVRDHGQERARRAWDWVEEVKHKEGPPIQKRYGTLARKLPSYLQASGLGQTLAFLHGKQDPKKTTAEGLLLGHLGEYLRGVLRRTTVDRDVMALVLALEPGEYRRATRELMALAEWLKRFAEGRLEQEQS